MAAAEGVRYRLVRLDQGGGVERAQITGPAVVIQSLSGAEEVRDRVGSFSSSIPLVGYIRQSDVSIIAQAIRENWPLCGLLIEDVSDKPWEVLETIRAVHRHTVGKRLEPHLRALAGDRLGRLSTQALADGRRINGRLLAEVYGTSRRTLRRHFSRRKLPPPDRWSNWLNVLIAVDLLGTSHRTITSIGFALGFDSGAALSQTCRRLTGTGLSAFRNGDGFETLMHHLRRDCQRHNAGAQC